MKIAFYAGRAWERWDSASPLARGIGGSETCLVYLPRELARMGCEVSVFIDTAEPRTEDGVRFIPYEAFAEFAATEFDWFIHFRNARALALGARAKRHVGFAQDITLGVPDGRALAGRLDFLFGLSRPHLEHLALAHGFPADRILMTANGVDPARYCEPLEKRPAQVFFSSCPSRDLDRLLLHCDEVARYVPEFRLVTAYGMQTWEGLLAQGRGDAVRYRATRDMLGRFPWVKDVGRIGQSELARLQQESVAWFYPTTFPETFCITAAEAGWARCAILASSTFGLETTIGDGGILLRSDPDSPQFREIFVSHAVQLLTDSAYRDEWSERASQRMSRFTWKAVAEQWLVFFESGRWHGIQ